MQFRPTGRTKAGGRQKGTPNKRALRLQELAAELGVDPFEILLRFAGNDWKGLGYASGSTTKWTASGIEYEEDVITPQMRLLAAKEAVQYLEPKRKAIEVDQTLSPEERQLVEMYREKMKALAQEELKPAQPTQEPPGIEEQTEAE